MRHLWLAVFTLSALPAFSAADTPSHLEGFFKDRDVAARIEMPASNKGVDVYLERGAAFDARENGKRLKRFDVAIQKGDTVRVTAVRVHKKHITLQRGGGGYGSITSIFAQASDNTETPAKEDLESDIKRLARRERPLKQATEQESAFGELRERELRGVQSELATLNDRLREEKARQRHEFALASGSRFDLRFEKQVHEGAELPVRIMAALAALLEFPGEQFGREPLPPAQPAAPAPPDGTGATGR